MLGVNKTEDHLSALGGDPKIVKDGARLYIAKGVTIRLTRNLDKARGFVNGAIGQVEEIYDQRLTVFGVRSTLARTR